MLSVTQFFCNRQHGNMLATGAEGQIK